MLSRIEIEFLKSPESFDLNYRRVLRHRVNSKIREIREELELLERCGLSVTENCNGVTEFRNGQQNSNQAALQEIVVRAPRFEPGSSAWQADVLDQTRLRALTLSSAKPLFKRFGSQKCRSMLYIAGFLSAMKNLLRRSSLSDSAFIHSFVERIWPDLGHSLLNGLFRTQLL